MGELHELDHDGLGEPVDARNPVAHLQDGTDIIDVDLFFKAGEQVDGGAELLEFAPAE